MKKKLFALGALSIVGASLMSGTPAFAADAEGTTNIIYKSSTTGPIGPIDPNNPDNDPNNWMVQYPKTINLNEQNKLSNAESGYNDVDSLAKYKDEFSTKAKRLEFKVMRQVAGTNGSYDVSADNIGNGIQVIATTDNGNWTGKLISMSKNGASNSSIKMAIGSNGGSTENATLASDTELIDKGGVVTTLKNGTEAKKNGYAVIVDSTNEVDGENYSTTVKFQFTRQS